VSLTLCSRKLDEMLRVDHAGETAAVLIYEGQAAVLGRGAEGPTLASMAEHEREHLRHFQRLARTRSRRHTALAERRPSPSQLPQHRVRPSALLPLWSAAAYALGACSALMGRQAAYAVTEAVESVITAHYNQQLRDLVELAEGGHFADESELRAAFRRFRDEEQEHLEEAVRRGAKEAVGYEALSAVVKAGCGTAIAVAKRI